MRLTIPIIVASSALFLTGCEEDEQSECVVVADVAQKCLSRARDQAKEDIIKDCEQGLAQKEMWTWASIDCYRSVGDDCLAWVECIRKDPYKKSTEEILAEQGKSPKKEKKEEEGKDE